MFHDAPPPESVLLLPATSGDPELLLWQCVQCKQTLQLPIFFAKIERNFNAGPNFMFIFVVKCSSVSIGSPEPSILCSRNICNTELHNFSFGELWRAFKSGKMAPTV